MFIHLVLVLNELKPSNMKLGTWFCLQRDTYQLLVLQYNTYKWKNNKIKQQQANKSKIQQRIMEKLALFCISMGNCPFIANFKQRSEDCLLTVVEMTTFSQSRVAYRKCLWQGILGVFQELSKDKSGKHSHTAQVKGVQRPDFLTAKLQNCFNLSFGESSVAGTQFLQTQFEPFSVNMRDNRIL